MVVHHQSMITTASVTLHDRLNVRPFINRKLVAMQLRLALSSWVWPAHTPPGWPPTGEGKTRLGQAVGWLLWKHPFHSIKKPLQKSLLKVLAYFDVDIHELIPRYQFWHIGKVVFLYPADERSFAVDPAKFALFIEMLANTIPPIQECSFWTLVHSAATLSAGWTRKCSQYRCHKSSGTLQTSEKILDHHHRRANSLILFVGDTKRIF